MATKPMLSSSAITTFAAYLPNDLTPAQVDRCIEAAREMGQQLWQEATSAQVAVMALQNSYKVNDRG